MKTSTGGSEITSVHIMAGVLEHDIVIVTFELNVSIPWLPRAKDNIQGRQIQHRALKSMA